MTSKLATSNPHRFLAFKQLFTSEDKESNGDLCTYHSKSLSLWVIQISFSYLKI